MAERTFYNEVLTDHNLHPDNKYQLKDPNKVKEGVNPSCGDEMVLRLRLSGDGKTIEEAAFTGQGCAVSQASADIMADLITGESVEEAKRLSGLFIRMIQGEELSDEEQEDLDERKKNLQLAIYWCAKEAIYKRMSVNGVDFAEQIEVERFNPRDEGEIEATFTHKDGTELEFELNYEVFENHVMVWVVG